MPPALRARHPQMLLELVLAQQPALHAELMTSLRSAKQIADAMPIEWLPIEVDVELIEALAKKMSPAALDGLVRDRQRLEMGSALFKTFVSTILRLLGGGSPAILVRHFPKGWSQVFSDCGRVEVVEVHDERHARLRIADLPPVCVASRAWIEAIPVGVQMLYELIRVTTGKVALSRDGSSVLLDFTW
jgi:hypothetical protein